ncbi:MAG: hypothetical protein CSA36_02260 [Draconibacterium sp.]|nr:MAG: hypothetical protein CSA36_02260 [Draconibacterium sp.]
MNNNELQIAYYPHNQIDTKKWDTCVVNSENSRVYANHWYLDRVASNWNALVIGDYQYVMPLPVRKKWGISYVYQPAYCQQLGIFPEPGIETAVFLYKQIAQKFRYCDVQLNAANPPADNSAPLSFTPRDNFLLWLGAGYEKIADKYNNNTTRNIAKALKNNLTISTSIGLAEYLNLKKSNTDPKIIGQNLAVLKNIIAFCQYKGFGEIHGVYDSRNQLCAAVFFCRWKNRVIYHNAALDNNGKKLGAMFFLLDQFIRKNAGNDLTLDFEGSMLPGVARFYQGFGALPETYMQLKINSLPWLLKWIKQ